MGKSKKNASSARAVPPSKQNPVGSFDRSSSPSSEEYEKVENVENAANSDDISNWSKVGGGADSGTDNENSSNNSQQPPTSSTTAPPTTTTGSKKEQSMLSSDSEAYQAHDDNDKKRTVSSKEQQPSASKNDRDNEEDKTLIYERITELRDSAPKTRKELYQSSYAIFSKIEQLDNKKKATSLSYSYSISLTRKFNIAKCVNEYTSLLFQYFEYLNQNGGDKDEKAYVGDLLRIWDLCERLNFSGNTDDAVVADMVDWLSLHWPSEETSTQDLQRFGSFDSDDEELVIVDHDDISNGDDDQEDSEEKVAVDWLLIRRNLLRGNVVEAIQMLKSCLDTLSADNRGCLKRVIQLAESMPTLPQRQNDASSLAAWQAWTIYRLQVSDEFEGFLSSGASSQGIQLTDRRVRKEINHLLKILCGDEKVISKAGTFLESFVGYLIYCEPFRTRTDTAAVAERLFLQSSSLSTSDEQQQQIDVVLAACQYILLRDWDGALSVFDDYYLQTHIGHAFICAGIMDRGCGPAPSMAHEACINPVYHIMNAYANSIAHEEDMWEEAMGYVSACSTNRDYWAKELLNERIESAKSTDDLKEMMQTCDDYQLLELKKLLCKVMAEKYEEEGNTQEATISYATAGDVASLDKLADKALQRYLESGVLEQVVTETNEIRATIEKSTHYKFLFQYQRLRNLLEKNQHDEAANLIKQMLTSIDAPAEFQVILLIDSMSILEETTNDRVIFSESETLDLMRRLQRTRNSLHANVFTQCYNRVRPSSPPLAGATDSCSSITNDNDVVSKISQSLAFNLANALISQ